MSELTHARISAAVNDLGWRLIAGRLCTSVPVTSLIHAADIATRIVAAAGGDGTGRLHVDLGSDRVMVSTQTEGWTTETDIAIAQRIAALGLPLEPGTSTPPRSVQQLEIAVDALDIAAVRPFWKAVLGYGDEGDRTGATDPLIDPLGQGPAVWFQQMEVPRPQRNRIHLDICVPHDEGPGRVRTALRAGGRLVSEAKAPAFWVLADAEGNEVCVSTWQGRD
ncbi:VOC family protein [Nonomuraea diastatica]|uniref:4a-hydroxytetrahydrobiopterin dehydratase n=1 Tax=Nonomuraea diastatica TaxID=1848329 RepID=A0A4R4WEC4_9ACTN|nr:VOC family protein [Nonomuraea diastatica]TDD14603.1 4a-hydroxytetrahydrobiopterin dehydratase [Nonomuraea diastatica]